MAAPSTIKGPAHDVDGPRTGSAARADRDDFDPSGYAGEQFTAQLLRTARPDWYPRRLVTYETEDQSDRHRSDRAFQFLWRRVQRRTQTYTWQVANAAAAGEYTIRFRCYTGAGQRRADGPDDLHVLAATETISTPSGYAGDQFTANIENCPTGLGLDGSQ